MTKISVEPRLGGHLKQTQRYRAKDKLQRVAHSPVADDFQRSSASRGPQLAKTRTSRGGYSEQGGLTGQKSNPLKVANDTRVPKGQKHILPSGLDHDGEVVGRRSASVHLVVREDLTRDKQHARPCPVLTFPGRTNLEGRAMETELPVLWNGTCPKGWHRLDGARGSDTSKQVLTAA